MAAARAARCVASVATKLTYPVRPPAGFQNGRVVTPTHWNKIGGIFPREPFTGELSKLHDEEDTRRIDVLDARDAPAPPSLAENGFELRTRATGVKDFYDDDEVRGAYYPEVAALVKAATGARDAVVFQHMRRDSDALNKEGAGARNAATAGAHGAVQRVHADYTPSNAPVKLRDLEAAGAVAAGAADGRRWSFVNVWRSIDDDAPVRARAAAAAAAAVARVVLADFFKAEAPSLCPPSLQVRALPLAVLDASTVRADLRCERGVSAHWSMPRSRASLVLRSVSCSRPFSYAILYITTALPSALRHE